MLQLNNIALKYSYKTVLSDVNLNFENGKIYSLLGENGAGKSTLAGIICGDRKADFGTILINSVPQKIRSPKDAINLGILCIHQRPLLCEEVSIKDNFLLGTKKIDLKKASELLEYFLPERKLSTLVKELFLGERFFVSLIGNLLKNPKFLILDEPSALLDENQIEKLFTFLKNLKKDGMTILIITHFIKEALLQSDFIVLLKDGVVVCDEKSGNLTEEKIVKLLYGSVNVENFLQMKNQLFKNKNITQIKAKNANDFMEKENEISVRVDSFGRKVGIIPSDRTFCGSNPNLTVFQICTALKTKMNKKELLTFCNSILQEAKINIKPNEKAKNLSGGMLQKLILEREVAEKPDMMILCEPWQGLDFLACKNLFEKLEEFSKRGKIVILEADK